MAADLHQACLSELGHEAFPRGTMTSGHAARGHPGNKGAGHWALWGWQWKQRNAAPVLEPHIAILQVFRGMWVPLRRRRARGTEGSDFAFVVLTHTPTRASSSFLSLGFAL